MFKSRLVRDYIIHARPPNERIYHAQIFREKENTAPQPELKSVNVHDFHDNTHVGSAATLDEALTQVVSHDIRSYPHRTYRLFNDFCEPAQGGLRPHYY